jgi:hypothetical protein
MVLLTLLLPMCCDPVVSAVAVALLSAILCASLLLLAFLLLLSHRLEERFCFC